MKRGTIDHPKTRLLCTKLDIPRYQAVGILESMWHFAAMYAHNGDIGRFSNEAIAEWIDFDDDAADRLVDCLVDCGWLDRVDGPSRLMVHHWQEHCDDAVKKRLQRDSQKSGHVQTSPDMSRLPEPEPEPKPNTHTLAHLPEQIRPVSSKKFIKPTIEEVREYVERMGVDIDADMFWHHYESNGWKVGGRTPMKSWHSAVATWVKRRMDNGNSSGVMSGGKRQPPELRATF